MNQPAEKIVAAAMPAIAALCSIPGFMTFLSFMG
jgi:hypothetical protein